MEGNPLKFDDFIIQVLSNNTSSSDVMCAVKATQGGVTTEFSNMFSSQKSTTSLNNNWWQVVYNCGLVVTGGKGLGAFNSISNGVVKSCYILLKNEKITKISINPAGATVNFVAGARVKLYVR